MATSCAFQLLFGQIYTFCSTKWAFVAAIVLFEIGSALCEAVPPSVVFIIGRAIAGIGSAGIFWGVIVIVMQTIPLTKRGAYLGVFEALFGIASIIGRLLRGMLCCSSYSFPDVNILQGAFTTYVTWR
jgi:MFS family permease